MKSEVIEAIRMLAKEKEISEESLFGTIEEALKAAYKKNLPKGENAPNNLDVTVNRETGAISVYARKLILEDEEIEDPTNQSSLKDAQKINPTYQMGDIAEVDVTPSGFLRVAAQTAKQVIIQHIREAERGKIYDEYAEKESEILTGIVERIEPKAVYVDLGRTEGVKAIPRKAAALVKPVVDMEGIEEVDLSEPTESKNTESGEMNDEV